MGRAGSGKTTVAVRLGERLGLPVIHLDRLFWGPNWQELPAGTFDARARSAIAADEWILDGGYISSPSWPERIRRAELVVVVEAPLIVCLWRIVRRTFVSRSVRRPDLPDGCSEQLSLFFVWWTIGWSRRHRNLAQEVARANPEVRFARVRSVVEAEAMTGLSPTDARSTDR